MEVSSLTHHSEHGITTVDDLSAIFPVKVPVLEKPPLVVLGVCGILAEIVSTKQTCRGRACIHVIGASLEADYLCSRQSGQFGHDLDSGRPIPNHRDRLVRVVVVFVPRG